MKKLLPDPSDLQVQEIIEKILIRNANSPYDYSRKATQQLTSQQHLWHYRLQQQNLQLKEKIKNLSSKFKKKTQQHHKCLALQKELDRLRSELNSVIKSNAHLQEQINQMRLKNSQINDSIQQSLDQSIKNRKHNRSCSCNSIHLNNKSTNNRHKTNKNVEQRSLSPEKEILKTKKEVAISCGLEDRGRENRQAVESKRQHIKTLKRIVQNQEKLMQEYSKEIDEKKGKQMMSKNKTMQSTSRMVYPIERTVSHNTFKPLSSAGSIVKIKRN